MKYKATLKDEIPSKPGILLVNSSTSKTGSATDTTIIKENFYQSDEF
jgi:hypothetical protein